MAGRDHGKRAIPAKNEGRCKLCRHPDREKIDQLLLTRSLRGRDAADQPVTYEYVFLRLAEWGVENPTKENCHVHFSKHVEVVEAETANAVDAATEELYAELIELAPTHLTATNVAEWQIKLWMARELARLRAGEGPSVTTDQSQVAQRILVQAKQDESARQLLGHVGSAIGAALMKQLPAEAPVEIEAAAVEVEDVG